MSSEQEALSLLQNRAIVINTLEEIALGDQGIGTYANPIAKEFAKIIKNVLERALNGVMPTSEELQVRAGPSGYTLAGNLLHRLKNDSLGISLYLDRTRKKYPLVVRWLQEDEEPSQGAVYASRATGFQVIGTESDLRRMLREGAVEFFQENPE